ncbi:trypsin-like cysteine/serine peptidase domain-containing protein [Aspergillus californicus]
MTRILRSSARAQPESDLPGQIGNPDKELPSQLQDTNVKFIPPSKLTQLPDLNPEETTLLRKKQHRLRLSTTITRRTATKYGPHISNALSATFIFAQHEAGTAVCVDPQGWILTCAHCFGESEEEWQSNRRKWLLGYTGLAVQVECRVWDCTRDLALAKVSAVEGLTAPGFPSVVLPLSPPTASDYARTPVICIGQPGADDLESSKPKSTDYDLVEISEGRLRGLVPGANPQDNSEIGTLKHDAWTYWGHSGAPLVSRETGVLLGLHSSWDDETAMRHGVPVVAIQEFLAIHLPQKDRVDGTSS